MAKARTLLAGTNDSEEWLRVEAKAFAYKTLQPGDLMLSITLPADETGTLRDLGELILGPGDRLRIKYRG